MTNNTKLDEKLEDVENFRARKYRIVLILQENDLEGFIKEKLQKQTEMKQIPSTRRIWSRLRGWQLTPSKITWSVKYIQGEHQRKCLIPYPAYLKQEISIGRWPWEINSKVWRFRSQRPCNHTYKSIPNQGAVRSYWWHDRRNRSGNDHLEWSLKRMRIFHSRDMLQKKGDQVQKFFLFPLVFSFYIKNAIVWTVFGVLALLWLDLEGF